MNAHELHAKFLELKALVESQVPTTIVRQHLWRDYSTLTYSLDSISLEDLEATYSAYVGCGDYEYTTEAIDLDALNLNMEQA